MINPKKVSLILIPKYFTDNNYILVIIMYLFVFNLSCVLFPLAFSSTIPEGQIHKEGVEYSEYRGGHCEPPGGSGAESPENL